MTHKIKHTIKNCIAYILFYTGILSLVSKYKLKHSLVVLMYHRVLSNNEKIQSFSNPSIIVNTETFENHISYLKSRFKILSLDSFIEYLENGTAFTNRELLITFDDGWYDNFKNALPILESHSTPALIFLPTDYIGTGKLFWQEQLSYLFSTIVKDKNSHLDFLAKYGITDETQIGSKEIKGTIDRFINSLKEKSNEQIDAIVDDFKFYTKSIGSFTINKSIDAYITWSEVEQMANKGISFGSHAVTHRLLTKLTEESISYELKHSKSTIEKALASPIRSIAYPNGNFNDMIVNEVKNSGYKVGFTTKAGYFQVGDNPYEINRINMHEYSTCNIPMLMCRVLGIF